MENTQALADVPGAATTVASAQTQKFSLFALTMMVVGSMVGAGIWSLPRPFATATGVFGAIIAWLIAAGGMYTLARVFQALAERKPDLDAGVYAYAKAGFGDYLGFLSAIGYFFSACLGNTFYWVLIKSTIGAFFPIFGDLFRRHDISGWGKAIWVIALIVFSYLAIFIYLITQHRGMAERQQQRAQQARDELRQVVGFSAADEIEKLERLKSSNTISDAEYQRLRARVVQ